MKTLLLVDDDRQILDIYARLLKRLGYDVSTAGCVKDVEQYHERDFDIAIIDGLNGGCFDVLNIVKAKRKVIYSGDNRIVKEAEGLTGVEAYCRRVDLVKILRGEEK